MLFIYLFIHYLFILIGKNAEGPLSLLQKATKTGKPRKPEPQHIAPSACSVDSAAQIPFPLGICTAGAIALLEAPP